MGRLTSVRAYKGDDRMPIDKRLAVAAAEQVTDRNAGQGGWYPQCLRTSLTAGDIRCLID
jgi:hypothetical protein